MKLLLNIWTNGVTGMDVRADRNEITISNNDHGKQECTGLLVKDNIRI
jgi:hypothetical protein